MMQSERIKQRFGNFLTVSSTDPDDARRKKLLNILLAGVFLLAAIVLLITGSYVLISGTGEDNGITFILMVGAGLMVGSIVIFYINRTRSGSLASLIFLIFLTIAFTFSDTPSEISNGRSSFVYAIPIVMASLLLQPQMSFLFAALSAAIVSILALVTGIIPNIPLVIGFFMLALVSWLSSRSLEQALRELRVINTNLDNLVAERTEELRKALVSLGIEAGRSQAILNGIADGVVVFDIEGKAIVVNPAISKLLEQPVEKIIGARFNELVNSATIPDKSREQVVGLIERTGANLPSFRIEHGKKVLSASAARVKDGSGNFIGTVAVFRDFTREAEVERMKNAFVAIVSHELRTPLNAISGYAEMLREGVYGEVNEKQVSSFDRIISNTQRLMHIVNDLLDQAQIEAGKLAIRNRPFRPTELLDSVHSVMDKIAADKGLVFTTEITPGFPAMISGDPYRLQQIMVNLVNNAVKFTDKGSIHARLYQVNHERWAIDIKDTGRGIPEDSLQTIFEAFEQVDSGKTREHRGVGLGLSIVKNISKLMGGDVSVVSRLGEGSIFTVTLPLIPINEEVTK